MKSKIIEALDIIIDGATATAKNAEQVFNDNIPDGLTRETIDKSNEYQREFHAAITEAALPKMVEGMKSDTKLGLMALEANIGDRNYGVVLTRPVCDNPSQQNYADGIAIYTSVRLSKDTLQESVNNAAKLWAN